MKPRLIILSDLWGKEKSNWVLFYTELLKNKFEIQYCDCCKLGEIDKTDYTEENLHNQFVNGGIEKAVANLLKTEKNEINILAFSIGGTIAWKASLKGLNVCQLIAVSSTRLRFEAERPNCKTELYFGDKDSNMPSLQWFLDLKISNNIFGNENHQLYMNKKNASIICEDILEGFD